jgi:hypothetical protein
MSKICQVIRNAHMFSYVRLGARKLIFLTAGLRNNALHLINNESKASIINAPTLRACPKCAYDEGAREIDLGGLVGGGGR